MARSPKKRYRVTGETGQPVVADLSRKLISVAVIGLVLLAMGYVGLLILSRTEGFKSLVAERLQRVVGQTVVMGACHLDAGLDLVLDDCSIGDTTDYGLLPHIEIRRLILDWHVPAFRNPDDRWLASIRIRGGRFFLSRDVEGDWKPELLKGLAGWIAFWGRFPAPVSAGEQVEGDDLESRVAYGPLSPWPDVPLAISGSEIIWLNYKGQDLASVRGLSLSMQPVRVPGRTMVYYRLTASRAFMQPGDLMHDFMLELLRSHGRSYVLSYRADWQKQANETENEADP